MESSLYPLLIQGAIETLIVIALAVYLFNYFKRQKVEDRANTEIIAGLLRVDVENMLKEIWASVQEPHAMVLEINDAVNEAFDEQEKFRLAIGALAGGMDERQQDITDKLSHLVDHTAAVDALNSALFDSSEVALFQSNNKGETWRSNRAYQELFDLDEEFATAETIVSRIDPRALETSMELTRQVLSMHLPFAYDSRLRKNGQLIRFTGHPVFEGGEFTGYIGTVTEIEEHEVDNIPPEIATP